MRKHESTHKPALLAETISCLAPRDGGVFADVTVGFGSMAAAVLRASAPTGRVFALDLDPESVVAARKRLSAFGERFHVVHGSYTDLGELAPRAGFEKFDGIVLDGGGVSREQLLDPERGFGFLRDGELDMRLDPTRPGPTAADLVNDLPRGELAALFRWAGESRKAAHAIASAIDRERLRSRIRTTRELAEIVERALRSAGIRRGLRHPATRVFLGLRLRVNRELPTLEQGLVECVRCLRPGGRFVVLSYHGLEHRLVRQTFRDMERGCLCPPDLAVCTCGRRPLVRRLLRKPLGPSVREVKANPSARSARLHCVIRTSAPM